MVDEEIREAHEVLAPRQQNGKNCSNNQCPLERILIRNDKQCQNKQHTNQRTHIDRSARTWLLTPILRESTVNASTRELPVCLLHGSGILSQWHRSTTLHVWHKQCPCLRNAITPCSDVVAVESRTGLIASICTRFHKLTLATHRVLRIFVSVIKIRRIDSNSNGCGSYQQTRCLAEASHLLLADSLYQESKEDAELRDEEIVSHLHVVAQNLQRSKECCDDESPHILASIEKHHTRNGWRNISQSDDFPDVSCRYNNKEIAAECPHDGTQGCHPMTEVEGTKQDIEAQHRCEDVPHIVREPKVIDLFEKRHGECGIITWSHLVSRHTTEDGVNPTWSFPIVQVTVILDFH